MTDKIYSPHIEEALIGSCIQLPETFADCRPMLRVDDLHDHRLRWAWESLCRLSDSGITADYLTVCKDLDDHQQLSEVGGEAFVAKLIAAPDNAMNGKDYARIVARDGTRRRILETAEDVAKRAFNDSLDVTETLHFAETAFSNADHGHSIRADFSKRFNLFNAFDALKPQPPIVWRVEKLFREGGTYIVFGDPGSKKTYTMIDLAVCVALGTNWIGLKTEQSSVLIVDEESGPRRMADRLGATLRGHMADENAPIWYVSLSQLDLQNKSDTSALSDLIEVTQAKLVIIDALADVMPGADENAVGETQPIFQTLRALAEKTGAAIIVIHHANKQGTQRGSSGIKAAVDLQLKVISAPDSELIKFEFDKPRDIGPFHLAASARFGDGQFYLVEADHPDISKQASKDDLIDTALIEAIEDAQPEKLSTNKLLSAVGGNREAAHNRLENLIRGGRIIRSPGTRKGSFLHGLP